MQICIYSAFQELFPLHARGGCDQVFAGDMLFEEPLCHRARQGECDAEVRKRWGVNLIYRLANCLEYIFLNSRQCLCHTLLYADCLSMPGR